MNRKSQKEIIALLKSIPVFNGLRDGDFREIIPLLRRETYSADKVIIFEEDQGESMYILIEGEVRVTRCGEGGEEISLGTLKGGAFFGEFSLIDSLPRSANVTAAVTTQLFTLGKSDFDRLLKHNMHLANVFYRNCLKETFSRFRNIAANFTFSQHTLNVKSARLDEINLDLSYAKKIQNCFINTDHLDSERPLIEGVRHSYVYHPCIEVGGDFLNAVRLEDGSLSVIIADVVGHGITAALATGVLKSAYTLFLGNSGGMPGELMASLNSHFAATLSHVYATCYCACVSADARRVVFAKGGHHHPLLWKGDRKEFETVACRGTGLGITPDTDYPQVEYGIGPGDKLLFFTDGVIEQHGRSYALYSEERLRDVFRARIESGDNRILEAIMEDLARHAEMRHFEDDVTMLLLEF